MIYTVHQLSKLAHVSIRTLHYYDEINLLKPSFVRPNGYRCYEEKELMKLQQILFFRELDFSLEHIKEIFASPRFNPVEALKDQEKLLTLKKNRLDGLLVTIHNTILSMKKTQQINTHQLYDSFNENDMEKYKEEARQRWGHTEAYKQSITRTKHWTKKDYVRVKEENEKLIQALIVAMPKGIESDEVQKLVALHHQGITKFYDCSYAMYRGLGKMYVEDIRFTKNYDKFKPGLADFLCRAIQYYCDQAE